MKLKGNTVIYRDSEGEKYGIIKRVNKTKKDYLVSPLMMGPKSWIPKEKCIVVDPEVSSYFLFNLFFYMKVVNKDFVKYLLGLTLDKPAPKVDFAYV